MRARVDIAIIGAGFAGAATAFALARRGARNVAVLEAEPTPGAHASGRNAALVRRLIEDPPIAAAAVAGSEFLRRPPSGFAAAPLVSGPGSLLLCRARTADALAEAARRAGAERIAGAEAAALAPELGGAAPEAAFLTHADGVADTGALLAGYLRGIEVVTSCRVLRVIVCGGRVAALETSRGRIEAGAVVDAAGAWAGLLAREAGAAPPPLAPKRRHLFLSAPGAGAAADRPYVWDIERGFYFRAEKGGRYLLSACDEDPHPPGVPEVAPGAESALRAKAQAVAPRIAGFATESAWACLRTFAPDGRFVVGEDPEIGGYFYAAGLGGHGVTTSAALGELAAAGVLDPASVPAEFCARRFRSCGEAPGKPPGA